jgi:type IV pilus assembly protein PilN
VIFINLLPHREAQRKLRKRAFFSAVGASATVGVLLAVLGYSAIGEMISVQQSRNDYLKAEIAKLDGQIRDIQNLRAEIDALKARQKAVEDLQVDRNTPIYLLDELVKQTPEGVYLTAVKQADQIVTVNGIAQTNERVSEFLRNTQYSSPWLEKPELVEIKVAATNPALRDQRRLFEFSMRVTLKRPGAATPAGAAASAAPADRKLS